MRAGSRDGCPIAAESGGFTLVEVLVVSLLAVVLTSMLFAVQQSTSRRSITTDRKRDAMIRSHRAYQALHAVLASSPRFEIATPAGEVDRAGDEEGFDQGPPIAAVSTPRGQLAFDQRRGRLKVREAAIDGLGDVTFHPESDTLLAFTVDSGPADSARERSQLYGKQFFEPEHDRLAYKPWGPPEEPPSVVPFAGGFTFPGTCGYRPAGEDEP